MNGKTFLSIILFLTIIVFSSISYSREKVFSKSDISKLAGVYINNNLGIKNPVIVDIDNDDDFDILRFTGKGNVEYYKNTGTLDKPLFVLENKKYDNYEVHSVLKGGIPITVFFADNDGDGDKDIFGVQKNGFEKNSKTQKYNVMYAENSFDVSHYTLITIILVLIIVLLLVTIL